MSDKMYTKDIGRILDETIALGKESLNALKK